MEFNSYIFLCVFLVSVICTLPNGADDAKPTRKPRRYRKINKTIRWTTAEFQKQALDKTNELRAKHKAKPMVLDMELSWDSEEFAKKVGEHCEELGSCRAYYSHKQFTGETVWVSETETSVTGDVPVQAWYDEGQKHNFTNNIFTFMTSQFTQLVWKKTEKVGFGFAVSPVKKYLVVVARFKPNGNWNYKKEFAENVEPATRRRRRSFKKLAKSDQEFYTFPLFVFGDEYDYI